MSAINLKVNGKVHAVDVDPTTPLLYVLSDDLALNGPKFGCGLGQCGACTVIVKGQAIRRFQCRSVGFATKVVHADAKQPDRAPSRVCLVEQLHSARGAFAGYFQPRDVVAQFDGKIERGFGVTILRPKRVACLADRRALGIDCAHHARGSFNFGTLFIILLVAAPLVGSMLRSIFGNIGGSFVGASAIGAAAWFIAGSLLIAALAAVIGFVVIIFSMFGGGRGGWSARRRDHRNQHGRTRHRHRARPGRDPRRRAAHHRHRAT